MTDEELMKIALSESLKALEHDDVPVGAIVVVGGEYCQHDITNVNF
tara:strand:+ start:1081 stop:1218 length:138 start_codon:yes stop_codon:yes gene_type:complete